MGSITRIPPSVPILIRRIEALKEKEHKATTQGAKVVYELAIYELQTVLDEVKGINNE